MEKLETFHDVNLGITRLLAAPRDLPSAIAWHEPGPLLVTADPIYVSLFHAYVQELNWAVDIALSWWNALVARRVERGATRRTAIRENYRIRPAGPAARPEVVFVVRKTWLECAAINRDVMMGNRIPPEVLLLKWLLPDHANLAEVLTGMPYWPIGFDESGHFV